MHAWRITFVRGAGQVPGVADSVAHRPRWRSVLAIGLSFIPPRVVPSRRGVEANTVAKAAWTTITAPTFAKNRRAPRRLPSSTPQKIRDLAVRVIGRMERKDSVDLGHRESVRHLTSPSARVC